MSIRDFQVKPLLLKWIPKFTGTCLKSFNISLHRHNLHESEYFDMSSILFKAKSLQTLYLKGCKLSQINSCDEVLLKRLHTLTLDDVHITKETLEMILSSNPLLENVSLLMCKGFKDIRVCKLHGLKDISIDGIYNPWLSPDNSLSIEIDIPTIERIKVTLCWFDHHKYLPHLTFLFLDGVGLSKSIDFLSGKMDIKASIDAPNIVLFVYESEITRSAISFTTTSSEWKSNITVGVYMDLPNYNALLWFRKLSELLHEFSRSKISFKLNQSRVFDNWPAEDQPSSLFESVHADIDRKLRHEHKPILEVEQLSLRGDYSYSSLPAFLNCLFRIFRPRYMEQLLYFSNGPIGDWTEKETELTEFLMHMFLIKEKNMSFWPRGLEEVTMVEYFNKNAQKLARMDARFQLEWEES
ncbi:hypothetical protein CASFOL_026962 [Castilleja foliolosa]|uniref:F-box/LRR-repeat protein 15/At3g58940/PEG3-like LRR domain-containing protein n=1 Tax=Castilleja foliolosa TaxID=1961234 RepID=A0ABD3CLW8_9LAMI